MDDARARRRADRKRNSLSETESSEKVEQVSSENFVAAGTRPKLSPIKESGSQRRRRRVSRSENNDDSTSTAKAEPVDEKVIDEEEQGQTEKKRRRKSKKNKEAEDSSKTQDSNAYLDSTLFSQIRELSDDIIETDEPVVLSIAGEAADGQSQPASNVFVEFPNGFKEMGRSTLLQRGSVALRASISGAELPHVTTTIDIAVQCQLVTHGILAILHGILAGFAICSCIMISYLHEPFHSEEDFLQHYKALAYPMEAILFILLTLCLLNALDRCDPGHSLSIFIQGLITFDATAILVVMYAVAFVLSLAIVNTEDKMGLLTFSNSTLQDTIEYDYEPQARDGVSNSESSYIIVKEVESSVMRNMADSGEMHGWWVVVICRCVLLNVAWVVFALRPFKYSLLERVQELPEEVDVPTSTNQS